MPSSNSTHLVLPVFAAQFHPRENAGMLNAICQCHESLVEKFLLLRRHYYLPSLANL
jgi:hypothetical protein